MQTIDGQDDAHPESSPEQAPQRCPFVDRGEQCRWLGDLEQALSTRTDQLQIKMRQLAVVAELGQDALAGEDIPGLLQKACEIVERFLGVDYAKILELSVDGRMLTLRAGVGWREHAVGSRAWPVDADSSAGRALARGKPFVMNGHGDGRGGETPVAASRLLAEHLAVSGVSVPIRGRRRPFGVLGAHSRQPRRFSPEDVHFLESLANILAAAVERKNAEDELRLQALGFENVSDALVIMDLRNRVIGWNRSAESIYGWSKEEMLGDTPAKVLPPKDRARILTRIDQAMAETGRFQGKVPFRRKDGAPGVCELSILPLRNAEDRLIALVGVGRDVTAKKIAEERLHLLTRAVESVGEGIVITDARAASGSDDVCSEREPIIYANPAFLALTGYSPDEILGRDCRAIMAGDAAAESLTAIREALRTRGYFRGEVLSARKDGRPFWNELSVRAIHGEQGVLTHHVMVHEDVSERRYSAAALQAAYDEMETRVRERTRELRGANAELMQEIMLRERVEEDLVQSRARFQAVFEHAGIGIALLDPEGLLLEANPALAAMLNFSREELLTKRFTDFTHPEDVPANVDLMRRLLSGETAFFILEKRYQRGDGRQLWVKVTSSAVRAPDGRPMFVVSLVEDISHRKRAEQALRERDALLKGVLDSLSAHIAVLDRRGRIIGVNEAWGRFAKDACGTSERLGVGANYLEASSQTCRNGLIQDKAAEALRGIEAVLEKKLPRYSLEYANPIQGRPRWFIMQVTPLNIEDGGVVVSHMDITKRVLAEEALKASEQNYRAIFNAVNDAIFVHNQPGLEIIDVNGKTEDLYGYAPFEARNLSISDLSAGEPPYSLDDAKRWFRKAAEGQPQLYEWLAKDKQGRRFWVEMSLRPTRIAGHDAILAVARDISERKRAEQELHFRVAFEKLITAISTHFINLEPAEVESGVAEALGNAAAFLGVDQSFVVLYDADGGREVVCSSSEPVCGMEAGRYTPDRLPWIYGRVLARYEALSLHSLDELPPEAEQDKEFLRSQGVRSCALAPLRFGQRLVGALCFVSFREEKSWSEEIVSLLKILGQIFVNVMERKRIQEELARRMRELARSNSELEQFAYVASHDLQEPLRMIASYVQLLSRRYHGKLDADADDFIDFAVDGVRRMQNIIRDLLAYSRVGTRGKPFEALAAEEPLQEALANLQAAIEETKAEIVVSPLPEIMADASQMTQLFQNLVGNAIKFRKPDQAPRVEVFSEAEDGHWRFTVKDDGIGLDPEYAERVFILFQRLHTREEYPGTGIGLAICKKIVERHGGRIWVESEPGQGAAFHFTIPTARRS